MGQTEGDRSLLTLRKPMIRTWIDQRLWVDSASNLSVLLAVDNKI